MRENDATPFYNLSFTMTGDNEISIKLQANMWAHERRHAVTVYAMSKYLGAVGTDAPQINKSRDAT
jgi:hypothetical protein